MGGGVPDRVGILHMHQVWSDLCLINANERLFIHEFECPSDNSNVSINLIVDFSFVAFCIPASKLKSESIIWKMSVGHTHTHTHTFRHTHTYTHTYTDTQTYTHRHTHMGRKSNCYMPPYLFQRGVYNNVVLEIIEKKSCF